jgi:hypothetical protein
MGSFWDNQDHPTAKNLVKRCPSCIMNASYHTRHHPARALSVPQGIFDRVHKDVGEAKDGTKHCSLFVDALSKPFLSRFGCHEGGDRGGEVALEDYLSVRHTHGPHSDNGARFVNDVQTPVISTAVYRS